MTDYSDYYLERLGSHGGDYASISLTFGANTVGRLTTNNIVLSSKYASRTHCTIYVTESGQVTVKNDIATNGIFVNGVQTLNRDAEIGLNINDILGIGCDTSSEEIGDEACFIFKIKSKTKAEVVDEVILLNDSDEEECKVQEEYSQMNISEMKQEYMECEDIMEEYSRSNSIKKEPHDDVKFVPLDLIVPTSVQQNNEKVDAGDVFEEIIANANKSYSEKRKDDVVPLSESKQIAATKNDTRVQSKEESIAKSKGKSRGVSKRTKKEPKKDVKESNERKKDRKETKKETTAATHYREKSKSTEKSTTVHKSPLSPRIKKLHVEIRLQDIETAVKPVQKVAINNSKAPAVAIDNSKAPAVAVHPKIMQRRKTFFPSSTLTSGSTKRPLEIINAPHMPKRRKSISVMPESFKPPPKSKELDSKWLSKKPAHKPQTKEKKDEIKSKLAALVPDPKDKVVEPKPMRTHTKIPVKNTHKTRSDQLTDTIVKTMPGSASKHKLNDASPPPEICKKSRMTEVDHGQVKPMNMRRRSLSVVFNKEKPSAGVKLNDVPECLRIDFHSRSITNVAKNISPRCEPINGNASSATSPPAVKSILKKSEPVNENASSATSPPAVKSILKKTNTIQKRRVTVSFAGDTRIKNTSIAKPVTPPVTSDEENSDDVIHNIMALGMSVLEKATSATINGKNFSYKTVAHEYDTLRHLQNVFIPLMKAELWKEIEDGFFRSKNSRPIDVQMNFCVQDENYPDRFKYHCETQSSGAIQSGALIMMLGINSGKEFLGYIVNRQVTNRICYFQFITPCSMQKSAGTPTPLKLKQIMYIRPNLKVFEALFKLKNSPLIKHILQPKHNCVKPKNVPFKYKGYNSLNQDQMITLSTVYRKCVGADPFISLIEGPPGTGKSRLITNLVLQMLYGKEMTQPLKILVCAPSNAAVDILTKNLTDARRKYTIEKGQKKMKLVRFGVLEKMDRFVRCVSLQELTKENNEKTALIEQKKLMECIKKKEAELAYYTSKNVKEKMIAIRNEITLIEAKMKNITYDEKCLLEGANVICTTLNSCCALSSKISSMDICIIDEATQCNEPTSLIPLQFGVKSLILVGDTKQLPSTVVSEIAKQYNYDQSLFQRLQKSFESVNEFENPTLQLTTQYRMHPEILHWPNQYFYKNRLVSDETTNRCSFKLKPYTVFNSNFVQSVHTEQKHISNLDEAKFVRHLLDFLVTKADPKMHSYGIISAYSQQKDDLAKDLSLTHPYVTVNTIDSCQGQERDIIIISIARTRGIGFLAIRQRLNVALTRARKMLILCGNFNSLQSHPMWTSLLDDAKDRKVYVHLPTMDDSLLVSYFEKTLTT